MNLKATAWMMLGCCTIGVANVCAQKDSRVKSESLLMTGYQKHLAEDPHEALKLWKKSIEADKENDAAHWCIAQLYARQGTQDGLPHAEKAVKLQPQNIHYHEGLARMYEQFHLYDQAIEVHEKRMRLDAKSPDKTLLRMAQIWEKQEKYKEALACYIRLEQHTGVSWGYTERQVQLYMTMKKKRKAKKLLLEFLEKKPEEDRARHTYLALFVKPRHFRRYVRRHQDDPYSQKLCLELRLSYEDLSSLREDLRAFLLSDKLSLSEKLSWIESARYARDDPSFRTALSQYLYGILQTAHPKYLEPHLREAEAHLYDKNKILALQAFRRAKMLLPKDYDLLRKMTLLARDLKKYDSLLAYSTQGLQHHPDKPFFYLQRSVGLFVKERHEEALLTIEKGLVHAPRDREMRSHLYTEKAKHLQKLGRHAAAKRAYEQAISSFPSHAPAMHDYILQMALRKEDLALAENFAERLCNLYPDEVSHLSTYALVLYQQGRFQEALSLVQKALALDESQASALELYGDTLYRLGEKKQALKQWKRAAELLTPPSPLLKQKIEHKSLP